MNKVKLICTIGPSSYNEETLFKLQERKVDFFRINLSHTDEEEIEEKIKFIKKFKIPLILDTEGSQVRSGNRNEILLSEGSDVELVSKPIECTPQKIFLNPPEIINNLSEGDLIFIDFNCVLLKVFNISNCKKGSILCKVLIGGKIGGRKAVYIDSPTFSLPAFSKKDLFAVKLAKKYQIKHFTLSFMESPDSVREFKKIYPESKVFSKIESRKGLENFLEIARLSDGILIDRGDLSSQVPIEKIPLIQKYLINKVRKLKKEVFIATNTLEQMSFLLKPNKAEVNDIINTILDGATGIALTKETAAGDHPVETVNMMQALINQTLPLEVNNTDALVSRLEKENYLLTNKISGLLIKPHGGVLVDRISRNFKNLPQKKIEIDEETLMDVEQIAVGSYSPLQGFLCKKDFYSVIEKMRLSSGVVWPLPICLQVSEDEAKKCKIGENISLVYSEDKEVYATLQLEDIFKINKQEVSKKLFGTLDISHPGVKKMMEKGEFCLGGKIFLIKRRNSPYKLYELTPRQTRRIFYERGWSKVLGFHTRNVIHKGHEFIQLEGLKKTACDGLFIHPVIGKKKSGDFEAEAIIETYEKMIEKFYPQSKVLLCSLATYSRYAGPREAIFTALVRKNFGCTHFIVGRDHTGVGKFYSPTASQEIFDKFSGEDLGIVPVKFGKVFYSPLKKEYLHELDHPSHPDKDKSNISGTEAREMIKNKKIPPSWFMRPEISGILIDKIKKGKKVFVE